ncbi:MAG: hypothetical protein V4608_08580 [Bacteroidota bacterium]
MKKNRIAIILIVLLGTISFWFVVNKGSGTIKETLRDFAVTDTASINKIFLADKDGNTITLERPPAGLWMVNGKYGVRPDAIQTLLNTIRKIDIKEPVGKSAQNNVIKRLATTAIKCEIYQNNELTKAYYVGTETPDQTGTFMILIDLKTMKPSAKAFVTYIPGFEGYLTTRYFVEENGWRDRSVFQYIPSDITSVKVESAAYPQYNYELLVLGNNSYEVRKMATNQTLANLDTLSVKQYLSYFKQLNFESFEVELNQSEIDSVLKSKPTNIVTVTDKKGQKNKVQFYARKNLKLVTNEKGQILPYDPIRMDALMNNGKDFVMVQYHIFGKILPTPDYFQKSK